MQSCTRAEYYNVHSTVYNEFGFIRVSYNRNQQRIQEHLESKKDRIA
jgi:hypothetical protein